MIRNVIHTSDLAVMRQKNLVPVLGLCLLVATTAYLMVFTLLGQLGASLDASRTALNWITIATIVVGTVSTALFPALGAVLGQRRLMVTAMGCLAAGSLISAAAPDIATLIAGRVVASVGLAAATLSIAIVREHRSGAALIRALGVIAAFEGAAAGTGFVLGGAAEEAARADWRAVFVAMAAIGVLCGALAAVTVPGGTVPGGTVPGGTGASRRIDIRGAALLAGGLAAALLPVTEGATWGWASPRVAGLFGLSAVLLAAWAVTSLRSANPLVRLAILTRPGVAGGTLLFLVTAGTVGVINLTVPSFLEAPRAAGYGAAASVLVAGLDLLPFAAAITIAGYFSARLARRVSPRLIAVAGLGCEALALALLAGFHHAPAQVVLLVAVFGAGHGAAIAAMYMLITRSVQPGEAGAATGLGSAVSGISGAIASAVITPVLVSRLVHAGPTLLPAGAGYSHAWLCGAALAAAGSVATALLALRARGAAAWVRSAADEFSGAVQSQREEAVRVPSIGVPNGGQWVGQGYSA